VLSTKPGGAAADLPGFELARYTFRRGSALSKATPPHHVVNIADNQILGWTTQVTAVSFGMEVLCLIGGGDEHSALMRKGTRIKGRRSRRTAISTGGHDHFSTPQMSMTVMLIMAS